MDNTTFFLGLRVLLPVLDEVRRRRRLLLPALADGRADDGAQKGYNVTC